MAATVSAHHRGGIVQAHNCWWLQAHNLVEFRMSSNGKSVVKGALQLGGLPEPEGPMMDSSLYMGTHQYQPGGWPLCGWHAMRLNYEYSYAYLDFADAHTAGSAVGNIPARLRLARQAFEKGFFALLVVQVASHPSPLQVHPP